MSVKVEVEQRYSAAGFVYVGSVRLVFAPAVGNRWGHPQDPDTLLLFEGNWGPVTAAQRTAAQAALQARYPGKTVKVIG